MASLSRTRTKQAQPYRRPTHKLNVRYFTFSASEVYAHYQKCNEHYPGSGLRHQYDGRGLLCRELSGLSRRVELRRGVQRRLRRRL
jgi:hypothetical protein